jgi:hypothetical protein
VIEVIDDIFSDLAIVYDTSIVPTNTITSKTTFTVESTTNGDDVLAETGEREEEETEHAGVDSAATTSTTVPSSSSSAVVTIHQDKIGIYVKKYGKCMNADTAQVYAEYIAWCRKL